MNLKNLNNVELLLLYKEFVEISWYDPFETPQLITELRNNGITDEDFETEILNRME